MDIYNNHKRLFGAAIFLFIGLTMFAAVFPALDSQNNNAPLPESKPLTSEEVAGKGIFIREGCIACHTQQVRNVDMDKMWGTRPSIAADYARNVRTDVWRNTANLMGSERTGPDLMNIGNRQPSEDWHLLHLYNPRSVVAQSIMPAYSWLFDVKEYAFPEDVVVNVPDEFRQGVTGKIIATKGALALVAYLKSFKQLKLPDGKPSPLFLYGKEVKPALAGTTSKLNTELDGAVLYAANCQSCHQENGEGLKGAFPALKGSPIVLDKDPKVQLTIIMKGYNGRASEGFGVMPAVGTNNNLKPEEVAAIMNHERTSWGNNGRKVTLTEIKELFNQVKSGPVAK
ncbi:cytochrome c [Mucilaginibacter aquariorum]|uniref:Cytochrome c n=1 Tax=Mucilaginibacter aquariorum TaxID=2967225 RepID=A0ABT1T1B3_9SPHI|nr:cbb3-type cytochrome c oxidase subunit II [Mucilaginibacter aquariorum]MCQ6958359.1 cytochrome c [Mucilaginibacter aquariorum]